jgi:hypothetical protein
VLHVPNNLNGDSPKVAGCIDLFRVQGRWAASARLAYIRVILGSVTDVSNNEALSKAAANSFPVFAYFQQWESFLEEIWRQHMNNIVKIHAPGADGGGGVRRQYRYHVDRKSMKQFVSYAVSLLLPPSAGHLPGKTAPGYTRVDNRSSDEQNGLKMNLPSFMHDLNESLHGLGKSLHSIAGSGFGSGVPGSVYDSIENLNKLRSDLRVESWSSKTLSAFISTVLRGFLYQDIYNATIEFLSRATGSFGLQVHCSLEPGVVVIGSKGQPMSLGYDNIRPIVLFASEASALAVPVDTDAAWLKKRIDLDSHGEIIRIGEPRCFIEGSFEPIQGQDSDSPAPPADTTAPVEANSLEGVEQASNKQSSKDSISTASVSYKNPTIFPVPIESYKPASGKGAHDRSAFDLLNDRISVHEKFQRHRSSSHASSIPSSSLHGSVHGPHYRPVKHHLNDSFHDDSSVSAGTPSRAIHLLTDDSNLLSFSSPKKATPDSPSMNAIHTLYPTALSASVSSMNSCLMLACGIEIKSYSLPLRGEISAKTLIERSSDMLLSPLPYDPNLDLIGKDLKEIPATLANINQSWNNPLSIESITSLALCQTLFQCIRHRMKTNLDTIDLLIAGVEVSLWIAEQFAADMRMIFPQLNVVTVSANKLLSLGHDVGRVIFPGSDSIPTRCIDNNTCALLISQSGNRYLTLAFSIF